VDSSQSDSVCRLHRSLYGLKQAPRTWFQRLSQVLLDLGFMGSTMDTSLFVFLQEAVRIYVLIYVDDIIVTSNKPIVVFDLITKLQHEFSMKDLGPLSYFLGIQVHRNREGLHLHQFKYIVDLLNCVNMTGAKPYQSPCISGKKLSKFDGDPLPDSSLYRHIVGALQCCTLTIPDIAFSVNQLC